MLLKDLHLYCYFPNVLCVEIENFKTYVELLNICGKVQVENYQEKAQSEKDSHSKNRGGTKMNY